MLLLARNYELVENRERTWLTAAVSAAGTTLTVRAVDTNAWADNDWVLVGEIGSNNAEILQVNGAVADGTSLTVDNAGSGGARFAHSIDEPVYRIPYNQIEFSRAATEDGSKSVLATNEIQPDDLFTRYEDTTNTTGFGFVRFYNSTSANFSDYSDGIPYTGYTARSLGRIMRKVRKLLGEPDFKYVKDEDIMDEVNDVQRDVAHERLWPFYEDIFSLSRVAYQREYDIDSDVAYGKVHTVKVESDPLIKIDALKFDMLHQDSATTGEPTHFNVWNGQLRLYPTPPSAATTGQLNGAITATATTITVDSTTGFAPSGRLLIESEVISYTNTTSTTFRGCTRGLEESTAATHADDTAITERDIIYLANREPNDLVDIGDESRIPDPDVLAYGAAMNLAIGRMKDETLHDRLKVKYDEKLERLRDKFGKKGTAVNYRIKDKNEIVLDEGGVRNPNDFPSGLS